MVSIYGLGEEFAALEDLLADASTADDHEVVSKWLEEINGALDEKLARCVAWTREQEGLAAIASGESKRLADLSRARIAKVDRLKESIREIFTAQGLKRVDTELGPVRIVGNGGKAPLTIDDSVDIMGLPDGCWKATAEPVRDELRRRIEAGESFVGISIGVRGSRVELG